MEKTVQQMEKEREAVTSMKAAKANMELALERIRTLEYTLSQARGTLNFLKDYLPLPAILQRGSNTQKMGEYLADEIAKINKALS